MTAPSCGWNPVSAGPDCDWDRTCPQHGDKMTADTPASDPYADSPDAGIKEACNCNGAWHAMEQHCVDWPCPDCTSICKPEPGINHT